MKTVVLNRIGYDRKILIKTFEIYLVLSCLLLIVHLKLLSLCANTTNTQNSINKFDQQNSQNCRNRTAETKPRSGILSSAVTQASNRDVEKFSENLPIQTI